ncbi:polysaccharide deacetylase family protein [Clostridium sartagoforme]|uniref:Polysaccharide deacetylase family protein n=1 Tax=Clostridium sartagoforme TaxID=84031 RepID=A0A4V3RL49_9CLOT|nr:polysaccharide deacetylase family protein [Clostridium sartagoforme]TGY42410.1 polysaccharide deacetylase family protein [Clostridium sartagoforme]
MKKKVYWIGLCIVLLSVFFISLYFKFIEKSPLNTDITAINSNYDTSKKIKLALKDYNKDKKAEIISSFDTKENIIAISFEGIRNNEITKEVLSLLNKYNVKSTFFVSGVEAAEDSDLVNSIKKSGHSIGSLGLSDKKHMEELTKEELISDFTKANKILETITGNKSILLKGSSTTYNDTVLASAYASGNEFVVDSKNYLSYQSFQNYEEAQGYVKSLKKGEIVSVKLEGVLDESEYTKKEEKPAIDKEAGIEKKDEEIIKYASILEVVEWLCQAINEDGRTTILLDNYNELEKSDGRTMFIRNDLISNNSSNNKPSNNNSENSNSGDNSIDISNINFNKLIKDNKKLLAENISRFYTTQEAVAYTFRGISNKESLDLALLALSITNTKGTFFVTKKEILEYPDRIEKILSYGNEIGNGGVTANSNILNKSAEEVAKEIYEVDKMLKDRGIYTNAYMSGFGYSDSEIREAVSAVRNIEGLGKYELITYSKAPIISKYEGKDSDYILNDYLNPDIYTSLSKGEIVYFRLDSGLVDQKVIYELMIGITFKYVNFGYAKMYDASIGDYKLRSKPLGYSVVTISNLQNNYEGESGYGRYELLINSHSLQRKSMEEALNLVNERYIGNEFVELDGFTEEEKSRLDQEGTIDTNGEDVIFFTFDDWGGDTIVNEILDVLDKHKVKGSFFTISKYIDDNSGISNSNPNLLRTIALKGHDIGSHNYNHEILEEDKNLLIDSLGKSYDSMANVIGDLDSLKPYFRPPTLYVNKDGLLAVFESGFDYSISGNISTHDYEATSPIEIINNFESQLQDGKGNIVVMHMNNQSYYTAMALDIFLTNNENGLYGKKYKIAKLSDYLK